MINTGGLGEHGGWLLFRGVSARAFLLASFPQTLPHFSPRLFFYNLTFVFLRGFYSHVEGKKGTAKARAWACLACKLGTWETRLLLVSGRGRAGAFPSLITCLDRFEKKGLVVHL